jgi:hypothetical protein
MTTPFPPRPPDSNPDLEPAPSSLKEMVPFVILALSVISVLVWLSKAIVFWQSVAFASQPAAQPTPPPVVQPSERPPADDAVLIQYLEWQLSQVSKARDTLERDRKQLEDKQSADAAGIDPQVAKANGVVEALKKLAADLSDLSKTDDNAKTVVDNLAKVGIRFEPTPSATPVPAPQP